MRLAVLMSSYNGEKFIARQLDSILAQEGDFTLDIIVRDDGSADTTRDILEAYADAGKPFGKTLRRAMKQLGSDPSNTAMLGDQLLTDALAGNLLGLKVFIVPPIRDKRSAFVRFKRRLERPVIRRYYKKHGGQV